VSAKGVRRRWLAFGVQSVVLGLVITGTSSARATPDFPGVVVDALGLPGITVDPPMGCKLCHPTDAGGTSLQPFGQLLQQYGAQANDEASLRAALALVEQNDPQLIADIKEGRDPNLDAGNVHTPQYGCGVARRNTAGSLPPIAALAAILLLGAMRRQASRTRGGSRPLDHSGGEKTKYDEHAQQAEDRPVRDYEEVFERVRLLVPGKGRRIVLQVHSGYLVGEWYGHPGVPPKPTSSRWGRLCGLDTTPRGERTRRSPSAPSPRALAVTPIPPTIGPESPSAGRSTQ
jgi:hypothetical protein